MVDLAVEVEVGKAGEAVERAFVPDFDTVKEEQVVAQFDCKGSQGEVHFKEFFSEGDGAVFAHDALGARVKKSVAFFRALRWCAGDGPRG